MTIEIIIPLLITISTAIIGWVIVHTFNAERDFQNKKREFHLKYLLESYRRLEAASSRGKISSSKYGEDFESAIADIQLLGSYEQTIMAKEMIMKIANRDSQASTGPLLMSLRNSLRIELRLNKIDEEPIHFRLA